MRYNSLKAVAAPSSYMKSIKNRPFTLTEEDKAKVIESVRRELLPAALERLNVALRSTYHYVKIGMERDSGLDSLLAIDLNGDGRKDFLGIYTFRVGYKKDPVMADELWGYVSSEVVFVMFDNGMAEAVSFDVGREVAFSLGGVIDIDGDGTQELIIQRSVDDYTMGGRGTKGENEYDQHAHYEIRSPKLFGSDKGVSINPEAFWDDYFGNSLGMLNVRPKKMASSSLLRQGSGEAVPISGTPGRPDGFIDHTYKPHFGETLRRQGDQVWRIESDGSTRGYFISE